MSKLRLLINNDYSEQYLHTLIKDTGINNFLKTINANANVKLLLEQFVINYNRVDVIDTSLGDKSPETIIQRPHGYYAEKIGCSRKTVLNAFKLLKESGIIAEHPQHPSLNNKTYYFTDKFFDIASKD